MSLLDNLVAYWPMQETSGNRADATGNGNTFTDHNSTGSTTGIIGNAANFVRTSNQYFSNSGIALSGGAISISEWFNPTTNPSVYQALFARDDRFTGGSKYVNLYYNDANRLGWYINTSTGSSSDDPAYNTVLTTGTWYHIVFTYDSTNGSVMYVNAVSRSTQGAHGTVLSSAVQTDISNDSAGGRYINGAIDEVGLWDRALTSTEVTQLYNNGAGLAYPFSTGTYPGYQAPFGYNRNKKVIGNFKDKLFKEQMKHAPIVRAA